MGPGDTGERDGATGAAVALAIPAIVAATAGQGVVDAQWFIAFHGYPVIWLVTTADTEKEEVAARGFFRPEVLVPLRVAGVRSDLADRTHVTVESQETVDRDFQGSWFYAMR